MLASLLLAAAAIVICMALLQRHGLSLGLPVAYLLCLSLIHLPGGLVHWLNPDQISGYAETELGLAITARSMLFFSLGVALCCWRTRWRGAPGPLRFDPRFWRFCAVSGLLVGTVLAPLRAIPSAGSLIQGASLIWIAGTILALRFHSSAPGKQPSLLRWIGVSLINPFLNLFGAGFLGYGVTAITQVYSFLLVRRRRLLAASLTLAVAFYLGLGVAVTYLAGRSDIRDAVWGGSTFQERLNSITRTFSSVSLFNPADLEQAELIDTRLNQNYLVGMAALNLQQGSTRFENGRTLVDAFIGLIPRAIWPDKPAVGGSGNMVSNYTGIEFAEGTSVGIGNVMEAYVNFGDLGCLGLFGVLGYLLRWLDQRAVVAEQRGNYRGYLTAVMPALSIMQPGGSMAEVVVGGAAAWLAARLWFAWWLERQGRAALQPQRIR